MTEMPTLNNCNCSKIHKKMILHINSHIENAHVLNIAELFSKFYKSVFLICTYSEYRNKDFKHPCFVNIKTWISKLQDFQTYAW